MLAIPVLRGVHREFFFLCLGYQHCALQQSVSTEAFDLKSITLRECSYAMPDQYQEPVD